MNRTCKHFLQVAFAAAFLGGCGSNPPQPEIVTKEVRVSVPVPCVEKSDIPPIPLIDQVTKESKPGEKIAAVVIHRERLIPYAGKLQALLVSCTNPEPRK